eukprot:6491068-Amphidinium_carterae.2
MTDSSMDVLCCHAVRETCAKARTVTVKHVLRCRACGEVVRGDSFVSMAICWPELKRLLA